MTNMTMPHDRTVHEADALADIIARIPGIQGYRATVTFDAMKSHRAEVRLFPRPSAMQRCLTLQLQTAVDRWIAALHAVGALPLRIEYSGLCREPRRPARPLKRTCIRGLGWLIRFRLSREGWGRMRDNLMVGVGCPVGKDGRRELRLHGVGGLDIDDRIMAESVIDSWVTMRADWFTGLTWAALVPDFEFPRHSSQRAIRERTDVIDLLEARRLRAHRGNHGAASTDGPGVSPP